MSLLNYLVELAKFFLRHRAEVFGLTVEHLWLVGVSMFLAALVGLPLGVLLTRWKWLDKPVLGGASRHSNHSQPCAFRLSAHRALAQGASRPAGHHGADPVCAAADYPKHLRRHLGVDPAVREAGRGMGMTNRQMLFQVELPLALGVILAGVRVATVITVAWRR